MEGLKSMRYIHLSIDDVILIFKDLTKNKDKYTSAFEQKTLKFLKELHEKYKICISLFCFYRQGNFSLSQVTDAFSKEFSKNCHWLKFGFHGTDAKDAIPDYSKYDDFYKEIVRITGSKNSFDTFPRVDRFLGTYDEVKNIAKRFNKNGITGLLTADSAERDSYYLSKKLSKKQKEELNENRYFYDNDLALSFIPTSFRFDDLGKLNYNSKVNFGKSVVIVFTHEWLLNIVLRKNILIYIKLLCKSIRVKCTIKRVLSDYMGGGYTSDFPQNICNVIG